MSGLSRSPGGDRPRTPRGADTHYSEFLAFLIYLNQHLRVGVTRLHTETAALGASTVTLTAPCHLLRAAGWGKPQHLRNTLATTGDVTRM